MRALKTLLIGILLTGMVSFAYAIDGGIKTVTVAGTAEALSDTSTYVYDLELRAIEANTGLIYVGGAIVDKDLKNGVELDADTEIPWKIREADLAKVYIDVTVGGEGVGYTFRQ